MIRLGLRLAITGGRAVVARAALIAGAVAVGVALLLTTLAASHAFQTQNERYAWLETGYPGAHAARSTTSAVDPLWWSLRRDGYQGEEIGRLDLAPTGPHAPIPPGLSSLPRPGQYYASPAMVKLLRSVPHEQLRDRYPGSLAGTIRDDALPAPNTLLVVIGRRPAEVAALGGKPITTISTTSPSACTGECAPIGTDANGMVLVLGVVAAALLFPVLIFIGGATRLSAARREQRFAAMRLVGATPQQVTRISTIESVVATALGVLIGLAVFTVARPAIARLPFNGSTFFLQDLRLTSTDLVAVCLGIPIGAAVAARLALRRVTISPLGVSRRVTPRPPSPVRLLPLVAGTAWMVYLAYGSDITDARSDMQAYAYLLGVFTVMIGLVVAGPWLTMTASRLLAGRAARPAGLIAARRLNDDPKAAFRAVSGPVLAVFIATVSLGTITTIAAYNRGSVSAAEGSKGVVVQTMYSPDQVVAHLPDQMVASLDAIPGVRGVAVLHRTATADRWGFFGEVVECSQLTAVRVLGRCPPGASVVAVKPDFGGAIIDNSKPLSDAVWPTSSLTIARATALPVDSIVVDSSGAPATVERVRTLLERDLPHASAPETVSEIRALGSKLLDNYRQLASVVLFTSLPIAGCSLAVNVAGGLSERRRPFSLLRLTGVPLTTLRRVISLETVAPLLAGVLVAAGVGCAMAALFLRAQLDQTLQPLPVSYYVLVAAGLLASCALIASMFPLLGRTTAPENARND
ncbi:MAG: ABC transporter permease [Acidimicrobiia bacterium]|nr:ABC transporter permease [Acidimicrobiia bacterium]